MYRAQFPYGPAPRGFTDEDFDHYFDFTTVALLNNTTLASGGIIQNINLSLQSDAPFIWRAIQVKGVNGADPVVSVQFKDPYNNYLSDDYIPFDLSFAPNGTAPQAGFLSIPLEPAIFCPPGATIWMSIKNQTGGNADLTKVRVLLSGAKRRAIKGVRRAA
jgi:hypothetical protein